MLSRVIILVSIRIINSFIPKLSFLKVPDQTFSKEEEIKDATIKLQMTKLEYIEF